MAMGTKIYHVRKAGPFVDGELSAGEMGVDSTSGRLFGSFDGTTTVEYGVKDITVNHGSNASTARPTTPGKVIWVGTVEPANAVDGDEWVDNS